MIIDNQLRANPSVSWSQASIWTRGREVYTAVRITTTRWPPPATPAGQSGRASTQPSWFNSDLSRKPIVPKKGEKTVERLTALDKSFHTDCFRCEVGIWVSGAFHLKHHSGPPQDCKVLLDNTTGSECFPVENKPFCHHCSNKRKS